MSEKPIGTLKAFAAHDENAQEAGVDAMVGGLTFAQSDDPSCKELLEAGEIGEIVSFRGHVRKLYG
jgi:predicted dehydrogenase